MNMQHTVAYIKTKDGFTLVLNNKTFSIGTSHRNYEKILAALQTQQYDGLEDLINIPATITARIGGVTVKNGQVFYNDLPMHNTVTERILAFVDQNLPTEPLIRFLENLMANPMPMAVAELYDFLEHRGFPITEDGCFIGYKGVREDWLDQHSGTVSNTIGTIVEMPREKVDPDRRNECSYGYHVGTLDYAKSFAARTLLVKVNPRDCVAVPKDHDCSKLRVCKYEVLAEAEGLIETPMYPMPTASDEDESWDDDDCYESDDYWDAPEDETVTTGNPNTVTFNINVTMPKRPPCTYCGAKGGKKHAKNCQRPRK